MAPEVAQCPYIPLSNTADTTMPISKPASLLYSSNDVSKWEQCLNLHEDAIAHVSARPRSGDLPELDKWLHRTWPKEGSLSKAALEKVLRWKLARGKWRPLMGRVQGNSANIVQASWKAALAARSKPGFKASDAVEALTALDGVGPATASAILTPWFQDTAFMSDEALEAAGFAMKYDLKTYRNFSEALVERAAALGPKWTAASVEKALWACAVLSIDITSNKRTSSSTECSPLRKPAASPNKKQRVG